MSQRSGNPVSVYSLGGEGFIYLAPDGTAAEDILDDGTKIHVVSWDGELTVTDQDVTDTRDYNPVTRVVNPRSLNTGQRLTGQFRKFHDSDPDQDILLLYPVGMYPAARLYITSGNVAVVGPPAILASRQCYFDMIAAQLMTQSIEGAEPTGVRSIGTRFQSNGIFNYVNADAV